MEFSMNGVLFRKSIGGYNKDDVNSYIESMSLKSRKREEELAAELKEYQRKLAETEARAKKAESRDFSEETEQFNARIAALEEKLGECEKLINARTEEAAELEARLAEATANNEILSAENAENQKYIEGARSAVECAKKYEELSKRLGEILLSAQTDAEKTLSDAQAKAAAIIADAEAKREKITDVLKNYTSMYCDKLGELTAESAKERLDRLDSEMAAFEASITRAVMNAKKQSGSLHEYLDGLRNSLESSLSSVLGNESRAVENDSASDNAGSVTAIAEPNEPDMELLLKNAADEIMSKLNEELDGAFSSDDDSKPQT